MHSAVHDLVYPSAVSSQANPVGVLFSSLEESKNYSFIQHQKIVFLSSFDPAEIQRCASDKIPVLLHIHSLQSAFDVLKLNGVKMVLVTSEKNKPIIDFGWMQKAKEEGKSVVFSFAHFQNAFQKSDVYAIQEYRKLSKLLEKSRVPFGIASFAQSKNEGLNKREKSALAGYLGVKSFSLEWVI